MKFILLIALLFGICFSLKNVAKIPSVKHAERVRERLSKLKNVEFGDEPPPAQWFMQRANHFQKNNNQTFKQRYWINDMYYNPSLSGPLFVQFGEEGEASAGMATNMAMIEYGKKHGALFAAIEHRFYGASQVTGNYEDLNLLSVDQALADFATVIESIQMKYNTTKTVVFGCSYIGAGVAWFRTKYPHISVGAVASSAPTLAVADFFKYLDQVSLSIKEQFGEICDTNIRNAWSQIITYIKSNSYNEIMSQYNICVAPKSNLDISTMLMSFMGSVMGTVQYDFEFGTNNIPYMCEVIGNGTTPFNGLGQFFKNSYPGSCVDVSYNSMIVELANTTYDISANGRQWTWQTCTEFGYFQTTTSPNQPFAEGDYVPLSFWEQVCNDAFKSKFNVPANIYDTNTKFGGNNLPSYWTQNVAFDNSVVDPWHTLSVQSAPNPQSPLFLYQVKGHCSAVSTPNENDPPSIKQTRLEIAALINNWLGQ